MKKHFKTLICIAIISIVFFSILGFTKGVPISSQPKHTDSKILMRALEDSGAQLQKTNLNFWSKMPQEDYSQEEMKEIILNCAKELGLQESEIEITQEDAPSKVTLKGQRKDQILATILMEEIHSPEQAKEIYFLVELSLGQDYKDLAPIETTITDYFDQLNLDYEYATTIVGTFEKEMNIDIMRRVLKNTFEVIDAEILEGMQEEEYSEMVSLSGYSPKIQNSIQLAGREINLNAAMRYNAYDQKTYLWIGSPLIATEY